MAVNFKVSSVALTDLLTVLRRYHPLLPNDARTLNQTCVYVQVLAGAEYFYFGILQSLNILNMVG